MEVFEKGVGGVYLDVRCPNMTYMCCICIYEEIL